MITNTTTSQIKQPKQPLEKISQYGDIVAQLDALTPYEYSTAAIERLAKLDRLFDNVSQKMDLVLVGGTNGKSSVLHFTTQILKEEGFKVGAAYANHFLAYNERIVSNFQQINNKQFADMVAKVLQMAEDEKIHATAFEVLVMSSLLQFAEDNTDIALIEVGLGGRLDATAALMPKIAVVTRVTGDHDDILGSDLDQVAREMMGIGKKGQWFISAEQSKLRLQKMKEFAEEKEIRWAMPIRKLASLPYIYEQLYGRTASLSERIAQIYVEDIKGKFSPFLRGNLLATKRGQRGRPTLEAKRHAELNPIKTLKGFWAESFNLLRGRFEILDKEKPTVLLDNARNVDALANLFLGIRLLCYQRPLRGLALVLGLPKTVPALETLKLIRYLVKKVSGQIFFVPAPDDAREEYHSPQELTAMASELNLKAKPCLNLAKAFEIAKKTVDERYGLVCVSGSQEMVTSYWKTVRELKKF